MLYICENPDGALSSDSLQEALKTLPTFRRNYALSYHFEHDRKACVLAYQLLAKALKAEYNLHEMPRWGYGASGKPHLEDHPSIHFNLSHCKNAVCCIISNEEVGVDVETIITFDEALAHEICSEKEYHHILNSTDPSLELTKLWTQKESYLKYKSCGLTSNIRDLFANAPNCLFTMEIKDGYVLCVCEATKDALSHNLSPLTF